MHCPNAIPSEAFGPELAGGFQQVAARSNRGFSSLRVGQRFFLGVIRFGLLFLRLTSQGVGDRVGISHPQFRQWASCVRY